MAWSKISALLIGACLISTASYSKVRTETRTVSTFGEWHALSEGDNVKYKCVITTPGPDKAISIVYKLLNKYISMELVKRTWALPPNTRVPVFIRMENYKMNRYATSLDKHALAVKLKEPDIEDFARHFSTAPRIYITFKTETNLNGQLISKAARKRFSG
jgi:hypothetical protein